MKIFKVIGVLVLGLFLNLSVFAQNEVSEALGLEKLIELLKHEDEGVRVLAAAALGDQKDTRAVPALIEALSDEEAGVRRYAVRSLGKIKDSRAVAVLIEALSD